MYRHHTNQVTGSLGKNRQAEPHGAVPTRTTEALFFFFFFFFNRYIHISIEYTFY